MMLSFRWVLFVGLAAMLVSSCKDEDTEAPMVNITSPAELTQFAVLDSMDVYFQVTDDRTVESVTVKLVNQDFIAVTTAVSYSVGANEHSGHAQLVIDDKMLASGNYFVLVSATDGTTTTTMYREVRLSEYPFGRRALYFGAVNGSGQGGIFRLDSLFSAITPFVLPGQDIGNVCISSQFDRLYASGRYNGGILHYDLNGGGMQWSASGNHQVPAPTYHHLVCHGSSVFASLYDREVRAYSSEGALILNRLTDNDRPYMLYANAANLLVERRQIGGALNRLFVYRNGNFSLKHELALPMHVVAYCERTANEVFIFGNLDGQAKVWLYDMEANSYWEPRQLPEGRLLHAVKGEGQTYFLAHESGLYHYTYSPNYLNNIRPNEVYQQLCFDRADGYLFAAKGNTLEVLAGQQGAVVTTFAHADSIVTMDIHYTK